ncbi:hypothetical protein Y600_6309 [Burkholderia pseudomallei MSHR3709]|nr:hypothetical protein Y600_6309 [Burkholderia pseudomallei MSHR3709]
MPPVASTRILGRFCGGGALACCALAAVVKPPIVSVISAAWRPRINAFCMCFSCIADLLALIWGRSAPLRKSADRFKGWTYYLHLDV